MGNKRKFIPYINELINYVEKEIGHKLNIGEGFSGSGIVSRLFKTRAQTLYVNDISGYSETLNKCYLDTPNDLQKTMINKYIDAANNFAENPPMNIDKWVSKHWAPQTVNPERDERVYFTSENGKRIDAYRTFINQSPERLRHYMLAPLLTEVSKHNNTNGQFSAFYKGENGIGKYGGKKEIDIGRITKKINIPYPLFSEKPCDVFVSKSDVNKWVREIPELDLVYYDPPYNKHPYSIYYFLLDIVNDWDLTIDIPDTYRGQPKNWYKSPYNSFKKAKQEFESLIKSTKAKFIMISYNNGGIIPLDDLNSILSKYGKVTKFPIDHKTYNRMKGIASKKRKKTDVKIKEFIWLVDRR
jgi:adenine-specific DNA-methyltransferase